MSEKQLNVTEIPPSLKHSTIFKTFDELAPNESFVLFNDHDPVPLKFKFDADHGDAYGWEYLERGPSAWRVRITKTR